MPAPHNTRTALAVPPRHTVASMMGMSVKFQRRALDEPCPYVLPNQAVGVELEYENAREAARRILDPARSSGYWNVTSDASLREHGEEFVLREGLEGLELAYAIREFFTVTHGAGLRESGRTSCHVHLDMRDAHIELLRATVLVYQAVEKMFWSLVHRQRRWTGYCIPLAEAQGQLVALLFSPRALSSGSSLRQSAEGVTRYSGLNVASISRHGTVEFRHFNNPRDEAQMNEWINICMSVRMAGQDLLDAAGENGVLTYVNSDTSRVVDIIQNNVILREACARASMTPADMQLEVDQLLAITESIYPTVATNNTALGAALSPEERSERFGHATGIKFRSNGIMSDYNKAKLITLFKTMYHISFGIPPSRSVDYATRCSNDLVATGWPRDVHDARQFARMRIEAYISGNSVLPISEAMNLIETSILVPWEEEVDRANAERESIEESEEREDEEQLLRPRLLDRNPDEEIISPPAPRPNYRAYAALAADPFAAPESRTSTIDWATYERRSREARLATEHAANSWLVTTTTTATPSAADEASDYVILNSDGEPV